VRPQFKEEYDKNGLILQEGNTRGETFVVRGPLGCAQVDEERKVKNRTLRKIGEECGAHSWACYQSW